VFAGVDVGEGRANGVLLTASTASAEWPGGGSGDGAAAGGWSVGAPGGRAGGGPGLELCSPFSTLYRNRLDHAETLQSWQATTKNGACVARWVVVARFEGLASGLAEFCRAAVSVAVDAPGGLSSGAHLGDLSLAPKFRTGRCSEVPMSGWPAVSWVTPQALEDAPGWMRTGFDIWRALEGTGVEVVETFPAACFHRLNGRRWPPRKSTPAGRAARLALLAERVELPPEAATDWSHDDIDAAACALVAAAGRPLAHDCAAPDGSVMWVVE
jgi:predicted nuclease with RNAse H fold